MSEDPHRLSQNAPQNAPQSAAEGVQKEAPKNMPRKVHLRRSSGILELHYAEGTSELSAEFLRVHSPSAEVRGHGPQEPKLVQGKRQVKINRVEAVGNYALGLHFDDGHSSGIYSWDYLHELSSRREQLWQAYLSRLEQAGGRREPLPDGVQVINIQSS